MQIDDEILFNSDLSSKAFKVFMYIKRVKETGNPELLKFSKMQGNFKEGRDAVRSAIKELEEKGYIKKEQKRVDLGGSNVFGANDYQIIQESFL